MNTELTQIDNASRELANVKTIGQGVDFLNKMSAIESLLKRMNASLEVSNRATELMLDGERKVGSMLAKMEKNKGGRPGKNLSQAGTGLADVGITRNASSRMQELAKVTAAEFRQAKANALTDEQLTRTAVRREVARILRGKENAVIEQADVEPLVGEYDVLVIDPPWPMEKIKRDAAPTQTDLDYPTMTEADMADMELPAAEDSHLFLWTTHRFLPMAFRLLNAWGFKYVCVFVWHKPGGFQPFNLPQYNCEFALYARRGSPKFVSTKAFKVCFQAGRGKHSEKPEEFYDMVRRVTAGRRVDVFNRRNIEGFDGWGKESVG